MTEHGLTMESLLSAFPAVLRKNPRLCAIAKLFAAKIVELDKSAKILGETRVQVIRKGIEKIFSELKK